MKTNLTYVTVFMDVYKDKPWNDRNILWRFEKFAEIAETGIQLCIYSDKTGIDLLEQYVEILPNIKFMDITDITNTWIYKIYNQYEGFKDEFTYKNGYEDGKLGIGLPKNRNIGKDTKEYILLMNAKLEYIKDTMDKNPFKSTHFAWIDFNISHVFKDTYKSKELLKIYSNAHLSDKFLCMPGCSDKILDSSQENVKNNLVDQINWRFCGGFFIGDMESLNEFYNLYRTHYPYFLYKNRILVWEVNFWAWLESVISTWHPNWFKADHNDSIIEIPTEYYALSLKNANTTNNIKNESYNSIKYQYPELKDYVPCSASYLHIQNTDKTTDKHILNTRYINYTLTANGCYLFNHPEKIIKTRNIYSLLDNETMNPISFVEINDPLENEFPSTNKESKIQGMEDIRIFNGSNGDIKFIATSVNYSNCNTNRMVIGKYLDGDMDNNDKYLTNCNVILPPNENNGCEKNWIPISENTIIYKWSPFEVGEIKEFVDNDKNIKHKLNIIKSISIKSPICRKFRGSTIFVEGFNKKHKIGVVHFSEREYPRHYFHCLVMLDETGMIPLKHSQPFYFENIGIEFCIGFCIKDAKYYFWISQFDRDPVLITIDVDYIPFLFDYN